MSALHRLCGLWYLCKWWSFGSAYFELQNESRYASMGGVGPVEKIRQSRKYLGACAYTLGGLPLLVARWVRNEPKAEGMRSYVLTEISSRRGKWCVLRIFYRHEIPYLKDRIGKRSEYTHLTFFRILGQSRSRSSHGDLLVESIEDISSQDFPVH